MLSKLPLIRLHKTIVLYLNLSIFLDHFLINIQNFIFLSSFLCNNRRNWILSKDIVSLNSISIDDIYRNIDNQTYCINISFSFHLFFTNYIYWLFGNLRSCWLCSHPSLPLSPLPWHPKIGHIPTNSLR